MAVEIFTKEQFEAALPKHKVTQQPMCQPVGLVEGEFEYRMPIDNAVSITIRSSINSSGKSAASGQDSIRAWLVDNDGKPLGSKVSKWTTRLPGWSDRLKSVLRTLWAWRKQAGDCQHCGQPLKIFKVKKDGPNKGRVFAKCEACAAMHKPDTFVWLED